MKALACKLTKIMASCAYVQKDGNNKFHNYNYASAAAILEKVNEACVNNNVASFVNYDIVNEKEKVTGANKDKLEYLVTVKCSLTIIDGDSGEEITATALGTGQDPGDKAVAKAQTMALKYAWMTTLNISTGDDPEADSGVDERNATSHQNPSKGQTNTNTQGTPPKGNTGQARPPATQFVGDKQINELIDLAKKANINLVKHVNENYKRKLNQITPEIYEKLQLELVPV